MAGLAAITLASAFGCALVAACSSFDPAPESEPATASDAGSETTAPADAAVEAPAEASAGDASDAGADADVPCGDDLTFDTPIVLADLEDVTSVRLTRDGATAFVSFVVSTNDEDIDEGPFPKGVLLYSHAVEGPELDSHPAPVTDPLRLFYEHGPAGARAVVLGTRAQVGQAFTLGNALPLTTGGAQAREPYALGSGSVLYFTMENAGARTIQRAAEAGGQWSTSPVGGVTSGLGEGHPVVTDDELAIFFSRGAPSDVWMATRASKAGPFTGALPVPGLSSGTADDRPTWLSPDRCTLLFTSNRSGSYRAYRASRR